MLNISAVDHLNINVENLNQTVKWYHDLFGFESKEEGLSSSGVPFKIIGKPGVLYIALYETDISQNKPSSINHIGFHLENFKESIQILREKGITINYGGIVKYKHSESAYILDPNGIEIELSSKFGGGLC